MALMKLDEKYWTARVSPDGAGTLRDEKDLQAAGDRGLLSQATVRSLQALAGSLLADAAGQAGFFTRDWVDWRPEKRWERPTLPAEWAQAGGADTGGMSLE